MTSEAAVRVEPGSLLTAVGCPEDLRDLSPDELADLASDIRAELVDSVSHTGGHLGPNLGVVELTIALHRVFESPKDVLIWDIGHQAYVHKMLTGRTHVLGTLRQSGGLSGYPSRAESEHDVVENSHASTALSYADGVAKAFAVTGVSGRHVVAVIGDGAMTGGLSWEALNNIASAPERPVIIVVNDNGRSYEPTVGALDDHLRALREESARGNLFEDLGLAYIGPVDGHDPTALETALRAASALRHPVVVHCATRKGAGYADAEHDEADRLHTIGPQKPRMPTTPEQAEPAWSDVFGDAMVQIAKTRPEVVAVTAAMRRPTGLFPMACRFPNRVYDVGIAEQHAVASAAGMAIAGMHPVVAIYSTFLNRAFDQVLMDAALHRAPVTFVLDRAGITGPDGPSHHGMWDISLLELVPSMRIAAPRDADQLRTLLRECVDIDSGPTMLRFPRGRSEPPVAPVQRVGSAELLSAAADADVLVIPVGPMAIPALEAVRILDRPAAVIDPRWIAPVDPELIAAAGTYRLVVTIEDNAVHGGFGSAICHALHDAGSRTDVLALGLPADFIPAGERGTLLRDYGLDADGIARAISSRLPSSV